MFWTKSFTFDGVPSENYSLLISSMANNSEESSSFPGDIKIHSEKLFRRSNEFLYATEINPVLEFPVTFTTDSGDLSGVDVENVGKWLFGRKNYAKLKILQYDISDVIYTCLLVKPQIIRVGNLVRAINCVVHCKDAWGVTESKTFNYTFSPPCVNIPITNKNRSDDTSYTYPTLIITMSGAGGDVSLTNTSDASRIFSFTGLLANEILTVNNDLQILSSSTGLRRLSNFNKKFFRLVNGTNTILVNGAVSSIVVQYPLAKKIGG